MSEPPPDLVSDAVRAPGDAAWWPGLPVEGAVAAVSGAVAAGAPVELRPDAVHPLPPLPPNVAAGMPGDAVLRITDRLVDLDLDLDLGRRLGPATAVLRPPSLVVGVGAARGVSAEEVVGLVRDALRDAGLSPLSVARLATVDAKAGEPGLLGAAESLGVPLVAYPAERLAGIAVPHPSEASLAAVGTPSVAEAAALADGGELLVPKRKSAPPGRPADATCAVVRRAPRGRLAVLGTGPGAAMDPLTPHAVAELRRASVVVGPERYAARIRELLRPGTLFLAPGGTADDERCRTAVERAVAGHAVALIGNGDAGAYPTDAVDVVDVVVVPGVRAATAAGSAGPGREGPEHVCVALADAYAPWGSVERRVRAAATTGAAVTLYGPCGGGRDGEWVRALGALAEHRPSDTPVMIVRNASRPDDSGRLTTLGRVDPACVDMMTVVTVGNTATRALAGHAVTPRGHRWQS
ncbi:cobalamin biosynthesis protein [Streptomyces sp. NPDC059248]|uniref:cobalamin biosynthesis protein n=1 Tax=Streptomyces sp. NPDC059248 TaxID=3346791 RepID=UPI00369DF1E0